MRRDRLHTGLEIIGLPASTEKSYAVPSFIFRTLRRRISGEPSAMSLLDVKCPIGDTGYNWAQVLEKAGRAVAAFGNLVEVCAARDDHGVLPPNPRPREADQAIPACSAS